MVIRAFHYDTGVRKAMQSIYFCGFCDTACSRPSRIAPL